MNDWDILAAKGRLKRHDSEVEVENVLLRTVNNKSVCALYDIKRLIKERFEKCADGSRSDVQMESYHLTTLARIESIVATALHKIENLENEKSHKLEE